MRLPKCLVGAGVSAKLLTSINNIHHIYLHPSSHPSPQVPDVFPDASNICTLLMWYFLINIHAPKGYKAGSYDQESLLESSGLFIDL